jgi:flagellar motor switch protein FliM
VGDIITTDKDVRSPLEVSVEGATKFHAYAGAYKGRKAVQVQAPTENR